MPDQDGWLADEDIRKLGDYISSLNLPKGILLSFIECSQKKIMGVSEDEGLHKILKNHGQTVFYSSMLDNTPPFNVKYGKDMEHIIDREKLQQPDDSIKKRVEFYLQYMKSMELGRENPIIVASSNLIEPVTATLDQMVIRYIVK